MAPEEQIAALTQAFHYLLAAWFMNLVIHASSLHVRPSRNTQVLDKLINFLLIGPFFIWGTCVSHMFIQLIPLGTDAADRVFLSSVIAGIVWIAWTVLKSNNEATLADMLR